MKKILLVADRLIDGVGSAPIVDGALLISGDRIEWLGPNTKAPRSEQIEVKEYKDCTILAGLVDAHVHLGLTGTADPWAEMVADSPVLSALKGVANAKRTLTEGITTVRDMGSKENAVVEVSQAIEGGLVEGCSVQAAGRCIVMTGGHAYAIGVEVDGVDEARKAARENLKAGAQVLKVIATGGVITPGVLTGSPQLTVEEMRAVVEEAHNAGKKVAAHAHGTQGIKNALSAGCDTIEHCSYLNDEALELFVKTGSFMVSTLVATMQLIWKIDNAGVPQYVVDKIMRHVDHETESLEKAIRAGLRIAAGSDSGTGLNPHNPLKKQLTLLVEHGMSPIEAIRAGTSVSAEAMGLADSIGTLGIGKIADLVLVKGDPSKDISVLENIRGVVKAGNFSLEKS